MSKSDPPGEQHSDERWIGVALPDMGLRSHLRDLARAMKSMLMVFFVLLVLIIIGGGCALLLR